MSDFLFAVTGLVVSVLFILLLLGASFASWQLQKARLELYSFLIQEVIRGLDDD
ncbi:hypothetical protein OFL75_11230 [Pseudomonas aeruginosa]|uniref:hypothetical protein n=1 Tax=Pseudomonas TaxID=286 RepID=UPI0012974FEF|nr:MULTISPECIES: hypothetical protein [Pseudomonas]DAW20749.1 MAG TPA: hypothetical protein [Caudoviricetes sp.]EKU7802200.1 hypothetical protein [Pseudomonas aeruginosa]EKX2663385.1 hypothetical protein [Pseudomonas aeruginosa]MBA4961495.1 hypothetical protein [Pseudomonas aeruginosa]MBG5469944.1 hypothetical protein [Pseudomonas aeruginosa]